MKSLLCMLILGTVPGWSQSITQPYGDSQIDPRTVNATTIVLLKLKPDQLNLPSWLQNTQSIGQENNLATARVAAKTGLEWLKQNTHRPAALPLGHV